MPETASQALLRPVDEETRTLARGLLAQARYAALAVLEPQSGHPLASRVALALDTDGVPIILISTLSAHTPALQADARCSLLVGEPGRGDPLAHPRLTLIGHARQLAAGSTEQQRARSRYLQAQPKSALYADFADFSFWRIEPERASLNAGFGRAYALTPEDLAAPPQPSV
jgi:hypothetical protein